MPISQHFKKERAHYLNYLILLLLCLLVYWPVSTGLFSVKNDAIHYFLPYRFQISEALRNGEWPFWSPYIYLGNPVYGDMQSGAWNPFVWIFSMIGRYDLTLLHSECLLYIFLGGVGMYKLSFRYSKETRTSLLVAAAYMLSGFMMNGQLVNWLASAAFVPFVIHYFLRLIQQQSYWDVVKSGIALFLLFSTGYPSFFILTGYLLLLVFLVKLYVVYKKRPVDYNTRKLWIQVFSLVVLFAGLSLPAIISYVDLLPYYQRGEGVSYEAATVNSYEWKNLVSLFFPSASHVSGFSSSTDLTMRNVYVGILTLLVLGIFPPARSRKNLLLIVLALFSFLYSLGDATPLHKICYKVIPLLDSFRHPAQSLLFLVIAVLLLAIPGIRKFLQVENTGTDLSRMKTGTTIIFIVVVLATVLALGFAWPFPFLQQIDFSDPRSTLKNLFSSIRVEDAIAFNGFFQVATVGFLLLYLRSPLRPIIFSLLWISNLALIAQFSLPASFVSKTSAKTINQFIHQSPKGYPLTSLSKTIRENSQDAMDNFETIGLSYFYNKKIGISPVTNSPAFLDRQEQFLKTPVLYHYVANRPFYYLADNLLPFANAPDVANDSVCQYAFAKEAKYYQYPCGDGTIRLLDISANTTQFEVTSQSSATVVLTQNFHHHWKAWVDEKPVEIQKINVAFMGVDIPPGKHQVRFQFIPRNTLVAMWVPPILLLLIIILAIRAAFLNKTADQ